MVGDAHAPRIVDDNAHHVALFDGARHRQHGTGQAERDDRDRRDPQAAQDQLVTRGQRTPARTVEPLGDQRHPRHWPLESERPALSIYRSLLEQKLEHCFEPSLHESANTQRPDAPIRENPYWYVRSATYYRWQFCICCTGRTPNRQKLM